MMLRIQIALLLTVVLLAGCGEVIIFGHVVREGNKSTEVKPESPPPAPPATNPISATDPVTTTTPAAAVSEPVAPAPVTPANKTTAPIANTPPTSPAAPNSAPAVINQPVKVPTIQRVKEVSLSVTSKAVEKVAKNSRFNANALLDAIKAELQSRNLFDAASLQAGGTLEISIDDYELHPNTNFVIFGATPNTGTLAGNVISHDENANALSTHHIETQTRISIPESGEAKNLLQPLYHEFAVAVADSLTGIHTVTSAERDQPPR